MPIRVAENVETMQKTENAHGFKVVLNALLLGAILCLSAHGLGQDTKRSPATDSLTWISGHLQTITLFQNAGGSNRETDSVSFKDCSITYSEVGIESRSDDPKWWTWTMTSTFDLSNLRPDKMSTRCLDGDGQRQPFCRIQIEGINPIIYNFTIDTSTKGWAALHPPPPSQSTQKLNKLDFAVPDEKMASRMTHAWRDAIIGCGGKEVPDNLY